MLDIPVFYSNSGSNWTPASNSSLTWFELNTTLAFSDAGGTVPSTVNGPVQTLKSKSGPSFTFSQATGAAQPTLKQAANGTYYLACSTTTWMETSANIVYTANTPFTMVAAYRLSSALASSQCILSIQGSNAMWLNNTGLAAVSYQPGNLKYGAVASNGVKNAWVLTAAGTSNIDPIFYRNGVVDAVTGGANLQTYPAYTGKVALNERTGIGTFQGPADYFGFGWVNGSQLSAADIAGLTTYMNNLMLGA